MTILELTTILELLTELELSTVLELTTVLEQLILSAPVTSVPTQLPHRVHPDTGENPKGRN